MKALPPGFAARLGAEATTLATCWRLVRRDGVTLGFTDHDRPIDLDGLVCAPGSGLSASETAVEAGFAVGGGEVAGALSAEAITEADLAAGLYDGATVETVLVDWEAPAHRLQLATATIGEVTRADGAFRAELRSPAHAFGQTLGRRYDHLCDAELGDGRCRVNLGAPGRRAGGTVAAMSDPHRLTVSGLAGLPAGSLARGRLSFVDGTLAGRTVAIRRHETVGGEARLDLFDPLPLAVAPGTAVTATVGCDKRFATCAGVFANAENFRGFPHVPGTDFLVANPARREPARAGRRVKA